MRAGCRCPVTFQYHFGWCEGISHVIGLATVNVELERDGSLLAEEEIIIGWD